MKIAITGHTSGLGKTLALELKKTHQIIGFSRKNIPIENATAAAGWGTPPQPNKLYCCCCAPWYPLKGKYEGRNLNFKFSFSKKVLQNSSRNHFKFPKVIFSSTINPSTW